LFEDLGPERYYPKVGAPAVALRIDMDHIREKAKRIYGELEFDCNLFDYFHRMTGYLPFEESPATASGIPTRSAERNASATRTVQHFLEAQKSLLEELSQAEKDFFRKAYPGLVI
jgi:hypothetical protein